MSVRRQIAGAVGMLPMPERAAVKARLRGPIERGGYTVWNVAFEGVTGNLYRPSGEGPFPAVLTPHGHWQGGRFMWNDDGKVASEIASGAERTECGARSPLQAFNANLAMMGCVSFIYDMVGYGDNTGVHGAGNLPTHVWNGLRSIDFLAGLPYVDAGRIGVAGASSGGLQAVLLAALDERITATAAVAMISATRQGGCGCEHAPRLRDATNNVEFAATIAPRAVGFASANDWTQNFVHRGLPELRRVYQLYHACDRLEHVHVPFGHNFNVHSREFVYGFFSRHLRLNQFDTAERPFDPVSPEQLRVRLSESI